MSRSATNDASGNFQIESQNQRPQLPDCGTRLLTGVKPRYRQEMLQAFAEEFGSDARLCQSLAGAGGVVPEILPAPPTKLAELANIFEILYTRGTESVVRNRRSR